MCSKCPLWPGWASSGPPIDTSLGFEDFCNVIRYFWLILYISYHKFLNPPFLREALVSFHGKSAQTVVVFIQCKVDPLCSLIIEVQPRLWNWLAQPSSTCWVFGSPDIPQMPICFRFLLQTLVWRRTYLFVRGLPLPAGVCFTIGGLWDYPVN